MFGWLFRPTCPCDPAAKAWLEERLQWLATEFAESAFTGRPVVLPTPEFFPDAYDGSKKAVRRLLDQVCEYMDVVPDLVAMKFTAKARDPFLVDGAGELVASDAAGTYEEGKRMFIIRISESQLDRPMDLVGTIAHELSHVRLLGEGRVMRETYDNELLTDLTTVHFGLGIFLANSPRNWESENKKWPGTNLIKPEYMTPPLFGYGLAHLAWHRSEKSPVWAKHLSWGARTNLKQGLRYLQTTGDSKYEPWHVRLGLE